MVGNDDYRNRMLKNRLTTEVARVCKEIGYATPEIETMDDCRAFEELLKKSTFGRQHVSRIRCTACAIWGRDYVC